MASRRESGSENSKRRARPATTPEGRENQLVSLAVQLAEKQLAEGTASAQVITHYLKLGSTREKLEQERLARENDLLRLKSETLESAKRVEDMYKAALDAMRAYSGREPSEVPDDF
jgi:hypothetical protein